MAESTDAGNTFTVLIPARMASSRLPNKPLADIAGTPMVIRVVQQAQKSQAQRVVVATDDARVQAVCEAHHVHCVMTRSDHPSGSDRLAEAAHILRLSDEHIVVNVQGDEPFIDPAFIDATARLLQTQAQAVMGTAAHAIDNAQDFHNPNVVKVVLNAQHQAQYFSRAPIPCNRDATTAQWWEKQADSETLSDTSAIHAPLRHIGIYSYRVGFLKHFPQLTPAPTERTEALEQLRVLWHGHTIAVHLSAVTPMPGVDTPEDLEKARVYAASLHS